MPGLRFAPEPNVGWHEMKPIRFYIRRPDGRLEFNRDINARAGGRADFRRINEAVTDAQLAKVGSTASRAYN